MAGTWIDDPLRTTEDEHLTDCPIQAEVWSQVARAAPRRLLVEVRSEGSAPLVASFLSSSLAVRDAFVFGSHVLVSASWAELIRFLLPLTDWAGFLVRLDAFLGAANPRTRQLAGHHEQQPPLDWSSKDALRLRWLVRSALDAHPDLGPADASAAAGQLYVPEVFRSWVADGAETARSSEQRPIQLVGLDRTAGLAVHRSRLTVKADAAERLFEVDTSTVTWAVVDTGIDAGHEAFRLPNGESRVVLSLDIPTAIEAMLQRDGSVQALVDDESWLAFFEAADVTGTARRLRFGAVRNDHGTHVAGILGGCARDVTPAPGVPAPEGGLPRDIVGIAPDVRLVDVKVFDDAGNATEASIIAALSLIRWLNGRAARQPVGRTTVGRIDGVNISLSVPFGVDVTACGWTPVCRACDDLVAAGVCVVVAAGNEGFDRRQRASLGTGFHMVSITDPGNTESVITVGATDGDSPYRSGPVARSGRGPTADGRHKPDVLAPGVGVIGPAAGGGWLRDTGTSQATAHVSGAAAMLIARFPELRGQPAQVKRLLLEHASDLGRLRDFQGHGLLDVLRAMQAH